MKFRARKTIWVGPFYFTFTQRGFTSWGIKVWRWRHNFTRGTDTFNTPGPGAVYWGGRRRNRRGR